MLAFVGKPYGAILNAEHHSFIARFKGFSRDARCLLIQMLNRRGTIFNRALFKYAEISDIHRALDELAHLRRHLSSGTTITHLCPGCPVISCRVRQKKSKREYAMHKAEIQ